MFFSSHVDQDNLQENFLDDIHDIGFRHRFLPVSWCDCEPLTAFARGEHRSSEYSYDILSSEIKSSFKQTDRFDRVVDGFVKL